LVLARAPAPISCPAESPGSPHPRQSVRESSSSICPASRDERRGLHIPPPPVSQQQAQMSPSAAGDGEQGWAGPASGASPEAGLAACPGAPAASSPAQPQLTTHAAAAPGSASGKRSCQIRRC
ncbi:hypothetical protein FQV19_0009054, partial [Eudyptula minor]